MENQPTKRISNPEKSYSVTASDFHVPDMSTQVEFFQSGEQMGSHHLNQHMNLLSTLRCCRTWVNRQLNLTGIQNGRDVLGTSKVAGHVFEFFKQETGEPFFKGLWDLEKTLSRLAETVEGSSWFLRFSSEENAMALKSWIQSGDKQWDFFAGGVRSLESNDILGQYLTSSHELIRQNEDFRIEYEVQANESPKDLSIVVGGKYEGVQKKHPSCIPEDQGYCFAYGGMGNTATELQKQRRAVVQSGRRIEKGTKYSCVAERVGGRFRFWVDNEMLFEHIDVLPVLGDGCGYVSLYTCGKDHLFSNVKVFTRPTCLPNEIKTKMDEWKAPVLETMGKNPRFVEANLVCTVSQDGANQLHLMIFKDITEIIVEQKRRMEAERLLRESHKMEAVGKLASGIGHDLNNPLSGVISFSFLLDELLREHGAGLDDQLPKAASYIDSIKKSASRCESVIANLMTFACKDIPSGGSVNPRALMEKTVELMQVELRHKRIKAILDIQQGMSAIPYNESVLQQAFTNIILNASQAIKNNGTIHIQVNQGKKEVVFIIKDDGVGVSERDREKVFEPFITTRPEGKGTGLGLTIANEIIRDYNGSLQLDSQEGIGTTVEIRLPLERP